MNKNNLVSLADRPPEERKAIARAGGYARAEALRKRKAIREVFTEILNSTDYSSPEVSFNDSFKYTIESEDGDTILETLCCSIVAKALNGDLKAARLVFEYADEPPRKKEEE